MDTTEDPRIKRINVAVNAEMLAAIDLLIDREGVTITEAVRRLIGYGDFVYRTVKIDGARLIAQNDTQEREIVLV